MQRRRVRKEIKEHERKLRHACDAYEASNKDSVIGRHLKLELTNIQESIRQLKVVIDYKRGGWKEGSGEASH